MKIVINRGYGEFGLSPKALLRCYGLGMTEVAKPVAEFFESPEETNVWIEEYEAYDGTFDTFPAYTFTSDRKFVLVDYDIDRANPILVRVIEELGEEANGVYSVLETVEIPDGVKYYIDRSEYGFESVHEEHRVWP